jgi:hypothetical protein
MFKKLRVSALGFALYVLCTSAAQATVIVDFDVQFIPGAGLTGMFEAQDLNNGLSITGMR